MRSIGSKESTILEKYLRKILNKENDTQIIHSHFTEISYSFIKAKKDMQIKIPIIVSEHSSSVNKDNLVEIKKDILEIADYVYKNCDELLVGSPFFQKRIYKKKDGKIIGSIHPWAFGVLVDFRILQSADRRWIRADGSSSKTGFIYHHGSQRHRTAMVYPDVMDFFGIARMGSQSGKR